MTTFATNAPTAAIIGGSGFVGRYIAQALAKRGWRVKVGCRRPNEAMFVRPYGVVGQVEPIQCNVRDDASVAAFVAGADAVIYSVGVLYNSGKNTFEAVQAEGPARAAKAAKAAGVPRFVLISAIGAESESESVYARTKAEGEEAVLAEYPDAVILRPSIVFGPEDQFFNRFAGMARLSPVIPVVGGSSRFQPVWVQDVAEAAAKATGGEAAPGTYELGGPGVYTFKELIQLMLKVIRRKRGIIDIPIPVGRLQGKVMGLLPDPPLTEDQVLLLKNDNVVAEDAQGFAALGIEPEALEGIIESYLVRFRPKGQYTDMIEAARSRQS
ncbi:MAG: complex I NDUFA9 subunit family protein [Pseudomonadota bacterium]